MATWWYLKRSDDCKETGWRIEMKEKNKEMQIIFPFLKGDAIVCSRTMASDDKGELLNISFVLQFFEDSFCLTQTVENQDSCDSRPGDRVYIRIKGEWI